MAQKLTDKWHSYPPPPFRPSFYWFYASAKIFSVQTVFRSIYKVTQNLLFLGGRGRFYLCTLLPWVRLTWRWILRNLFLPRVRWWWLQWIRVPWGWWMRVRRRRSKNHRRGWVRIWYRLERRLACRLLKWGWMVNHTWLYGLRHRGGSLCRHWNPGSRGLIPSGLPAF